MFKIRRSSDRGYADHGWLKSHHSFSFADYFDRANTNYRSLRVINQDDIAGGGGFPTHPHKNMEIVTYVTSGALAHRDTLGNHAVMKRGDVQRMTAGTGIAHSEFNNSQTEACQLLQIWIMPELDGLEPGYEQKDFSVMLDSGVPILIASRDGRESSVTIHQDAEIWAQRMKSGSSHTVQLPDNRHAWLQVVSGVLAIKGAKTEIELQPGDALAVNHEPTWTIEARGAAETLLFNLA